MIKNPSHEIIIQAVLKLVEEGLRKLSDKFSEGGEEDEESESNKN